MRLPLIRGVLAVAMLCGIVTAGEAPGFTSKAVHYTKINLGGDGAKVLVLAFDESKGTDTGYDVIQVVPVGFKHAPATIGAKQTIRPEANNGHLFNTFAPLDLEPYAKAAGVEPPVLSRVMIAYSRNRAGNTTNEGFHVRHGLEKTVGGDTWTCEVEGGNVKTSSNRADAPLLLLAGKPTVKFLARQAQEWDGKKKIGIDEAIAMVADGVTVFFKKNGRMPTDMITMTVKAKNGEVVIKESGDANKFSFG